MKTLTELQKECSKFGIIVDKDGRGGKLEYVVALRQYHWHKDRPGEPVPEQLMPMLLHSWEDLDPGEAEAIENDHHSWCVQPKMDGCRTLVFIGTEGVWITGRTISEVTYRLTEHQENLKHLLTGWDSLEGTVLDGELICPKSIINTGSSITASPLQAAVGILATSPEKAANIQAGQAAHLEFHVFDILRYRSQDVTAHPLYERLDLLDRILAQVSNPFVKLVPTGIVGKRSIHNGIIEAGREGSCWKRLDSFYYPGRRVTHWIKRKRNTTVEGFVSGWKAGNNGHSALIGTVEFSTREADGSLKPLAWVSNWTDRERQAMSLNSDGMVMLKPSYLGRRALLEGQDLSAKSRRIRNARIRRWLDE